MWPQGLEGEERVAQHAGNFLPVLNMTNGETVTTMEWRAPSEEIVKKVLRTSVLLVGDRRRRAISRRNAWKVLKETRSLVGKGSVLLLTAIRNISPGA